MTTKDRLNDLITAKADMKSAIESKGVEVTGGLTTYADAIRSIEGGGGATLPVGTKFGYSIFEVAPLFDTSGYTEMTRMFYDCPNLTTIPSYNTSNVVNMNDFASYCKYLVRLPQIDTSKVTKMQSAFWDCERLHTIASIDTSKVTTMYRTFAYCYSLYKLPLLDCGNVKDATEMLRECTYLQEVGGFKDLGKQEDLKTQYMFKGVSAISHDSLMNIINNLYDRASAGFSSIALQFYPGVLKRLSDEEKAIATKKGWALQESF